MSRLGFSALLAGGIMAVIFTAGFFHAADRSPSAATVCKSPAPRACEEVPLDTLRPNVASGKGLLGMTNSPAYKRAGDLSLRVADCTKAEDDLESRLTAIKGEILDMVMEGTEGSRTCTLSAIIPADQFRTFITELRKMGKVQSERITASKLRPGQGEKAAAAEAADPRELSLVSIRMADEKVAQTVLESRSLLAASFDRSASHVLNGLATLIEGIGYVLPYFIVLAALAVPIAVVVKLRRAREIRLQA